MEVFLCYVTNAECKIRKAQRFVYRAALRWMLPSSLSRTPTLRSSIKSRFSSLFRSRFSSSINSPMSSSISNLFSNLISSLFSNLISSLFSSINSRRVHIRSKATVMLPREIRDWIIPVRSKAQRFCTLLRERLHACASCCLSCRVFLRLERTLTYFLSED